MITNTNIPIPFNCSEWTILDKIDLSNVTQQWLESTISVRVGRDYHSSSIVESVSPFTAIYDLDLIQDIVSICGVEYLTTYIDPRSGGNILHAIMLNPNINVIEYILSILPSDVVTSLANSKNRFGMLPLMLIYTNMNLFTKILSITDITESELRTAAKRLPTAYKYMSSFDSMCKK